MLIDLQEVNYVLLELHPDIEQQNPVERVSSRNFYDWWPQLSRADVYGFWMFSQLEAEIPSIPVGSSYSPRPLRVESGRFNLSTFHFCNSMVMSWPHAKKLYGWNDDPRLVDPAIWSGAFFSAPWRDDMLVYYSHTMQRVYPATYDMQNLKRTFIVDEFLNSSYFQS